MEMLSPFTRIHVLGNYYLLNDVFLSQNEVVGQRGCIHDETEFDPWVSSLPSFFFSTTKFEALPPYSLNSISVIIVHADHYYCLPSSLFLCSSGKLHLGASSLRSWGRVPSVAPVSSQSDQVLPSPGSGPRLAMARRLVKSLTGWQLGS